MAAVPTSRRSAAASAGPSEPPRGPYGRVMSIGAGRAAAMPAKCTNVELICIRLDSGALRRTFVMFTTCCAACCYVDATTVNPFFFASEVDARASEIAGSSSTLARVMAGDSARLRTASIQWTMWTALMSVGKQVWSSWPDKAFRPQASTSTGHYYVCKDLCAERASREAHVLSMFTGREARRLQRREGASARKKAWGTPTFFLFPPPEPPRGPLSEF